MESGINRKKQLWAFAGVLIVSMMLMNNIVFLHAHKLKNGQILIHAHPYSKDHDSKPFKAHHHSLNDLIQIQHLQLLFFIAFFLFSVFFFTNGIRSSFPYHHFADKFFLKNRAGRSPPCLLPDILH